MFLISAPIYKSSRNFSGTKPTTIIKLKHPPFSIHALHDAMMLASSAPSGPGLLTTSSSQASSNQTTTNGPTRNGDDSSSTSPTNTSASDASMDMIASLMNAGAAAAATVANSGIKQESPLTAPPPIFTPDAVTLLQFSQLFQAQQAVAQLQAAQRIQNQQTAPQPQQHQNQTGGQERKRSYPCTFQYCVICQKDVHSSKLPCHIRQCHVAKPMFQCPACDFTSTYSKNNVKSHMVSLHGLAGDPISYMDKYAGQVEEYMKLCFPNVRGRGRPMQGRSSPKSPVSPSQNNRRTSQASLISARRPPVTQNDILSTLHHHQQQHPPTHPAFNPLRNFRFNPLQSIFPNVLVNNNNNNNNNGNKHIANFLIKEDKDSSQNPSEDVPKLNNVLESSPSCSTPIDKLQPIKPGENSQPRYTEHQLDWSVLNDLQAKKTIFSDCRTNMEIYIENISRKIESTECAQFVLTEQMASLVEQVRNRVNIQLFEVMFAIHRMDVKILDASLVDLLLQIAPTNCDAQLLRKIENVVDPNEEFLMGLTKIDHIEEKLETMKHMHMFRSNIESVNKRIATFENVFKAIWESRAFRNVMQLILAILNIGIFDDRQCLSLNGFSICESRKILERTIRPGQTVRTILKTILKDEINLDLDELFALISVVEKSEEGDFNSIPYDLSVLDDRTIRAEREMEHSGSNLPLSEFVESSKNLLKVSWQSFNNVKQNLLKLTVYLGNPIPRQSELLDPRGLLTNVLELLKTLRFTIDSDEGTDSEDQHINILSP